MLISANLLAILWDRTYTRTAQDQKPRTGICRSGSLWQPELLEPKRISYFFLFFSFHVLCFTNTVYCIAEMLQYCAIAENLSCTFIKRCSVFNQIETEELNRCLRSTTGSDWQRVSSESKARTCHSGVDVGWLALDSNLDQQGAGDDFDMDSMLDQHSPSADFDYHSIGTQFYPPRPLWSGIALALTLL